MSNLVSTLRASPLLMVGVGIVGLLWGTLLNLLAVRILIGQPLRGPAYCTHCHHPVAWYEQLPFISSLLTYGRCASCHYRSSFWYLLIELLSACWWIALIMTQPPLYIPALIIFGSALLITIRTDGEYFMILRLCTIGAIPTGIGASLLGGLSISFHESLLGLLSGTLLLLLVRWAFYAYRGYQGLGEGDIELLGMIGSFVGPYGVWLTLMIASVSATGYALILITLRRASYTTPIPFGLFLACAGAITALSQALVRTYMLT